MAINVKKKIYKENNPTKNLTNPSFVLYYIHNQMKERGLLMNIQKLLATTVFTVAVGSMSFASQDVMASQKMLNQLGYSAGTVDGIAGNNTNTAITEFYADAGKIFDGNIDANEVQDLKQVVATKSFSVEDTAKQLKISLSGWYIDETTKENQGKYYLPSPNFFQLVQNQPNVFYKKETAWGDFNGDGILDIVVHGEGHRCGTGGTYGKSVTQDGRWSCESKTDGMVNAQYPPFVLFNQDPLKSKVTIKQNVFDFAGPNGINIGYGSTVARNVIDDFNGDGIDDIWFGNAQGQNYKGKWVYKGPNHLLISNGPNSWKQGVHTGYKTHKKAQIYTGFSHGSTSGDIDNDGDIDIISTEFKGTVCHFNDGNGNFHAKLCTKQLGFAVTAADYNGDGNLDLVVAGGHYNMTYDRYSPSGGTDDKMRNRTVLFLGDGKGKFKQKGKKLEPAYGLDGKYMFSTVVELVSWDFDNDGDADIVGSTVGPFYAGAAWIVYENDGKGKFTIAENNIMPGFEPKESWKDPKVWGKEISAEHNHPYNAYCQRTTLIDVNDDGLMDATCNSSRHSGHANWFFINKGNLSFDVVKPEYAEEKGWVRFYNHFQFH